MEKIFKKLGVVDWINDYLGYILVVLIVGTFIWNLYRFILYYPLNNKLKTLKKGAYLDLGNGKGEIINEKLRNKIEESLLGSVILLIITGILNLIIINYLLGLPFTLSR
jgi:hypothetical protein